VELFESRLIGGARQTGENMPGWQSCGLAEY
jgi:hypothetical protein